MKRILQIALAAMLLPHDATAGSLKLTFASHIQAGLPELDVYLPALDDDSLVMRISPNGADGRETRMLYASLVPVPHDPFDDRAGDPLPRGAPLGLTLNKWLSARGTATVSCTNGTGHVHAQFEGLIANAAYTLWHAKVPQPSARPFLGALIFPLGERDGSHAGLKSDGRGQGRVDVTFTPCLAASNGQFKSMLALAWNSDGKAHGSNPGDFGLTSHVQIFAPLTDEDRPES